MQFLPPVDRVAEALDHRCGNSSFPQRRRAHARDGFLPHANWGKWSRIYNHKTLEDRAACCQLVREPGEEDVWEHA